MFLLNICESFIFWCFSIFCRKIGELRDQLYRTKHFFQGMNGDSQFNNKQSLFFCQNNQLHHNQKIQRLQCNGCHLNQSPQKHQSYFFMNKTVTTLILVLIIAIQAIHLAYAARYYLYQNQLDDAAGTPYSQFNSNTTNQTYGVSFIIVASGLSVLGYTALILSKVLGFSINQKVEYNIKFLVALFQFTLAVVYSIETSSHISPSSSNAGPTEKETNYTNVYWLRLSDAVITFVICVPGSSFLFLFDDNNQQGQQVEQSSTAAIKA